MAEKDIFVKLKLKPDDFKKGMSSAKEDVKSFAKGSVIAIAAVTAAFALTTGAVATLIRKQAELANRTVDLSDQLGTSASELAALSKAAFEFGITQEGFTQGLLKMRMALGQASDGTGEQADALKDLGLQYKSLQSLDATDQFEMITDALHKMTDENKRAELSQALFGRQLGKTANAMARVEGTAARLRKGGKNIIGMDDTDFNLLANIPIELDKVSSAVGSIFGRLGAEASPAIQALLGEVLKLVTGFREEFLDGSIDTFLTEKAPEMIASFVSLTQEGLKFTTEVIKGLDEMFGILDEGAGKTDILSEVVNTITDTISTARERLALGLLNTAERIVNAVLWPFKQLGHGIFSILEGSLDLIIKASKGLGLSTKGLLEIKKEILKEEARFIDGRVDFSETRGHLETIIKLTKQEREDERTALKEKLAKQMQGIKDQAAQKAKDREAERMARQLGGQILNDATQQGLAEVAGLTITIGEPDPVKKETEKAKEKKRTFEEVKFSAMLQRGSAEEARIAGGQANRREEKQLKAIEKIAKNTDPKKQSKNITVRF